MTNEQSTRLALNWLPPKNADLVILGHYLHDYYETIERLLKQEVYGA